jgi:DNA invertase Pin-like site-specific DNA recombinase
MKAPQAASRLPKSIGVWISASNDGRVNLEEREARRFAENKKWAVREVYRTTRISGERLFDHPEARRMFADIEEGRISALICTQVSHLANIVEEIVSLLDIFGKYGANLVSLREGDDFNSPAGRLMCTMVVAANEHASEKRPELGFS